MRSPFCLWLSILAAALMSLIVNLSRASDLIDSPRTVPACRSFVIEGIDGKTTGPISCRFHPVDADLLVTYSADKRAVLIRCPSPRRLPIVVTVTSGGKESVLLVDVEITNNSPTPQPKPVPPVEPGKPVVLSPFAQRVRDEVNKITGAGRAQQAVKIANALKAVRSRIAANTIDTSSPEIVVAAIKAQTGKQPSAWSGWVKWWNVAGCQEFQKSKMMTPGNWLELIDGTVEGLLAE
jgi:hypothetical protein